MARHLYIAGVDRWKDLEREGNSPAMRLDIDMALTYQIDVCRFYLKGDQPAEGEEVIIEDSDLGRLFAGIIVKVEMDRVFPDKSVKVWQVDCDDYTALLDRRLVVESYENMSASDIFLDIVAKYCPGFTTNGVRPGAPVIESTGAEFEYKRPSECFRWLCDYVGWHWQPDYYKDLHFFSAEELANPAPMTLTPGGKFRLGRHSLDTQGLRNRVYVRGGTMLSDPQVVRWKADGVARIWALPWPPHEVSLTVGEVPMTIGVENLHDEADFDYMMSFTEKYIRCSAQTPTPVEGITMALTARQDIPVITMVEDYASQAAISKVQGGDGIYEHVISDDTLTSIAAAEAAGMADLREHANPRVKGSFETEYAVPPVPVEKAALEHSETTFADGTLEDVEVTEGGLKLKKTGDDVTRTEDSQADFEQGTLVDVGAGEDGLELEYSGLDSYTKLLLHMDGEDSGTIFTDECGKTVTRYGDVCTKIGIKKIGTASGYFSGTKPKLDFGYQQDFDLNNSDGTVDFWVYFTNPTTSQFICGMGIGWGGNAFQYIISSSILSPARFTITLCDTKIGDYLGITDPATIQANTWYHVAMTKQGKLFKLYVNGSLAGSVTTNNEVLTDPSWHFTIGDVNQNQTYSYPLQGAYIDEFRISKGIARWTENFTPPDTPYGASYAPSGSRISPPLDLSAIDNAVSSQISWSATTPTGTSITIECAINDDPNTPPTTWQQAANGGSIPGITTGADLTGKYLWVRQTLSTTDTSITPQLHSLTVRVSGGEQYVASGYYLSPPLPLILNRGKITASQLSWDSIGEGIALEADISLDGGKTWQGWQECSNPGVIPVLPSGTELSGSPVVRYRITLSTEDTSVSSAFSQIDLSALAEVMESRNWQPGQLVNICLPDRGIEGEYLIQRVTLTPITQKHWTYRVEYGGRLLGIADFLQALVSAQQKKRIIEPTKNVQKYIYSEDTLELSDELITTPRTLPFVCGDPDAICGLVVVSNG